MINIQELNVKYITDKRGKKKEVILPLKEFERLIEDLEYLAIYAERQDELTISHCDVLKELQKNGNFLN
ncbi:hypothetical protein JW960_17905 [candidate division KSB1 bacterium]|nr:hypothetical protein [candidate division KSB1 bacterium]